MASYLEPLIGRECTRITFDAYDPPLVLWFLDEGPVARVEISGPLTLHVAGVAHDLDPTAELGGSGALLLLVGRRVKLAQVRDDEDLYLEFVSRASLEVRGGSSTEPWWFHVEDERTE